jgi:hypothetical protein
MGAVVAITRTACPSGFHTTSHHNFAFPHAAAIRTPSDAATRKLRNVDRGCYKRSHRIGLHRTRLMASKYKGDSVVPEP